MLFLTPFLIMKNTIKYILQKILGFNTYLFVFAIFIIKKLNRDKNEKDFIHFLNLLPDNGLVLDIGANIGIMTVHLARKLPNSKIVAFEPIPQNLKTLHRVIKYYKLNNVSVKEIALGNENNEIEMVLPVVNSVKMQGLSHVVHDSIDEYNEGIKIEVDSKKLDDIEDIKSSELEITGIKIDIENFEYFALKGGENLIKKHKPIIYCELWENENRTKCFDLLKSLDYKVMVLDNDNLSQINENNITKQNFFFIP